MDRRVSPRNFKAHNGAAITIAMLCAYVIVRYLIFLHDHSTSSSNGHRVMASKNTDVKQYYVVSIRSVQMTLAAHYLGNISLLYAAVDELRLEKYSGLTTRMSSLLRRHNWTVQCHFTLYPSYIIDLDPE